MKFVTKADAGQWIRATSEYERIIAKAATAAIRAVGREGRDDGRRSIADAGFSRRWQRSLVVKNIPPGGPVLNPQAYIHTTINYADIFETGGDIHGDPILWLPLPSVPSIGGREHMTVAQYFKTIGPLIKLKRPAGKAPILAAIIRRGVKAQPFGQFATRGQLKRGTAAKSGGLQAIPMFVGVESVHIPKQWDVTRAIELAAEKIPERYLENLEKYEGR